MIDVPSGEEALLELPFPAVYDLAYSDGDREIVIAAIGAGGRVKFTIATKAENFLTEAQSLSPGDLVVHVDHGIGRFSGLKMVEVQGAPHDCLLLEYHGGDRLFLPVEIGVDGPLGGPATVQVRLGPVDPSGLTREAEEPCSAGT